MRTDGHDVSRFVPRAAVPPIDHEANGPISALVRALSWAVRAWRGRTSPARDPLLVPSRRWL